MTRPVPWLMYHEVLSAGRSPARPGAGYARYVIDDATFREHVETIRAAGATGVSATVALRANDLPARPIALTFDDGCESDLVVAAPVLRDAGFGATFFVTVGHLDTPGFMTRRQLRELADAGFEIGSHGMTHAYLSDLDETDVRAELADSRSVLEDVVGRPVLHFSCPGGRWSRSVADIAREAGYTSVCVSRPVSNAAGSDHFRLGRLAITSAVTPGLIGRIARDGTIPAAPLREAVLGLTKKLLGNRLYDRARRLILEHGAE